MIKLILNKIFYNPYKFIQNHKEFVTCGNSILTREFNIKFTDTTKHCISIENNSILGCNMIFERDSGYSIGNNVYIAANTSLISINKITIGDNVQISWGVTIYDHNGYSLDYRVRKKEFSKIYKNYLGDNMLKEFNWNKVKSLPIVIEDDVWIGFGATILKGVTIGKGAIVSANSMVTKDVEPFTVVMGNPAVKVKELKNVE